MEFQQQPKPEPTVSEHLIDLHMLASEPPNPSSTYSASLTRLKNGYLHCISVLEAQNEALEVELEKARAKPVAPKVTPTCFLEAHNKLLQSELKAARAKPVEMRGKIVQLENTLAVRNKALSEKNKKVIELEGLVRKLSQDLEAAKREHTNIGRHGVGNGASGGSGEGSRKLSSLQGKRKWGDSSKETAEDPWSL